MSHDLLEYEDPQGEVTMIIYLGDIIELRCTSCGQIMAEFHDC